MNTVKTTQNDLQAALARELDIGNLPSAEQKKVIADFGEVALQASLLAVLETLAPAKREEFSKLMNGKDGAALQQFIAREVPRYEEIAKNAVAEEVRRFKEFQKNQQ